MRYITKSDREDEFSPANNYEERRVVTLCAELLRRTDVLEQRDTVRERLDELETLL